MHQRLNIIVGNRSERLPLLQQQIEQQGIVNYVFWDGIYKYDSAKENINAAHKQIVEYALVADFESVIIAEDDIRFFAPGAWDYFLANRPDDYDLYLSSIYVGDIKEDNTVDSFCGFGLYMVHSRFYQKFLETDRYEHIDRALAGKGKFVVCDPMVAEQTDGWSSNTGKDEKYRHLLNGRNLFGS